VERPRWPPRLPERGDALITEHRDEVAVRDERARKLEAYSRLEPASSAVPAPARKNNYQDNDDQKGGVVHLEALQHSWSHHATRVALPRALPCAAFGLLIVSAAAQALCL
jgi:hypothetical protein